ncbi:MAG TPA: hypothetical protein VNO43_07515 [Candidatus Eisenbacteria bacterium]|nr:hypothetical protein [Candidatus Eisenbacteria bacterium]
MQYVVLLSLFAVLGCAATPKPADREQINREMPLVVDYENKRNAVKQAIYVLAAKGIIDQETGRQVKESMDIEHVYYEASLISLARGEMAEYRAYVGLAEQELNRTKSAITNRVKALDPH